ncbi:MAG TPA: succinylglutamate desuccinylase/aspartoacylase family protein [Thermoleophilia bacterium]
MIGTASNSGFFMATRLGNGLGGGNRKPVRLMAVIILTAALVVGLITGALAYKFSHNNKTSTAVSTQPARDTSEVIQKTQNVTLMPTTEFETTAFVMTTGKKATSAPTVFVLAGVHGDEPIGRQSAERLLSAKVVKGTLIVLPAANQVAIRKGTRVGTKDLNRSFPGSMQGANEDRLAAEIFQLIQDRKSAIVLTCHVSPGFHLENPAMYGQTVIFDEPLTRPLADSVVNDINVGIAAPVQKFSVLIEPIATSATYEIYYRLNIPAYGLEVAAPLGPEQCTRYHLSLIKLFCDKIGLEISNWNEIINPVAKQ